MSLSAQICQSSRPCRGRVAEVDLAVEAAHRIFDEHVQIGATVETLWFYEPLDFRRRCRWEKISPHRATLLSLFQASGGYLLHQTSMESQVFSWMSRHSIGSQYDASQCAYRLRVMMSHLRDAKINSRNPPMRYDSLRCISDIIELGQPPKNSNKLDLDGDSGGGLGPFSPGLACHHIGQQTDASRHLSLVADFGADFDEDLFEVEDDDDDDDDEDERPALDYGAIDGALARASVPAGPTLSTYRAAFAVAKRPAASAAAITKKPAASPAAMAAARMKPAASPAAIAAVGSEEPADTPEAYLDRKVLQKRVYSRAYHGEEKRQQTFGLALDQAACKAKAM